MRRRVPRVAPLRIEYALGLAAMLLQGTLCKCDKDKPALSPACINLKHTEACNGGGTLSAVGPWDARHLSA